MGSGRNDCGRAWRNAQEQQTQLLQEAQVAAPDKAGHFKAAHAKSTIENVFKGLVVAGNWQMLFLVAKELAGDPELTHISQQLEEIIETEAAMCTKRAIESQIKIAGLTEALKELRSIYPPGKDPPTDAVCTNLDASLAEARAASTAAEEEAMMNQQLLRQMKGLQALPQRMRPGCISNS